MDEHSLSRTKHYFRDPSRAQDPDAPIRPKRGRPAADYEDTRLKSDLLAERIPAALRHYRKLQGKTLQDVAYAVIPPTTPQTIQRIESGQMATNLLWVDRILTALDLRPEVLYPQLSESEVYKEAQDVIRRRIVEELRDRANLIEKGYGKPV